MQTHAAEDEVIYLFLCPSKGSPTVCNCKCNNNFIYSRCNRYWTTLCFEHHPASPTLWIDQPWTMAIPSFEGMGSLLGIALLSTALAYVIYFRLLKTAGATNLLLVTLLIPVSAIILGVFLLDESLEPQHLSGMAVISLGLLIMDGRLLQFFRKTFPA